MISTEFGHRVLGMFGLSRFELDMHQRLGFEPTRVTAWHVEVVHTVCHDFAASPRCQPLPRKLFGG